MFGDDFHITLDDDGNPYLDRDPKIFKLLLRCLKNENHKLYFKIKDPNKKDPNKKQLLKEELELWGLLRT